MHYYHCTNSVLLIRYFYDSNAFIRWIKDNITSSFVILAPSIVSKSTLVSSNNVAASIMTMSHNEIRG